MAAPRFEEPPLDCPRCPRLVAFLDELRALHPDWKNAPVRSFGALDARLLIVGLAPGMRGANRTGRPFTGDYAGDLLYSTLLKFGFATGTYGADPADGLRLADCRIANAVRCLPPENKPLPIEFTACRPFIQSEIAGMPGLRVLVALGKGAHDQILRALAVRPAGAYPFIHGRLHTLPNGLLLADSYHCSRYNTNTGRLTTAMFHEVFAGIRRVLPAA
ncbi:MAG: uracil-DNA glycosylase [Reyranella sp.]|uniref:uracil-DNA glycosylase n=1 Tax=Reyranella sp. TaxID=1929291 RepID=UPI00272F7093|nr:uracil-DNA glycosylase [Reyranella sp.]MDP1960868.1 uracil-DNA glycosylase [Reyranella sp.]MDP2373197.1 uracil-DNA glycosylase [Reyranella sp.]